MSSRRQSHCYKRGKPGADCYIGACGGASEERDKQPFSPKGQSGKTLRKIDPNFEEKTLMNISTRVMHRPATKQTQPTVADCRRNKKHIEFVRKEVDRIRGEGGRAIIVGKLAQQVCRRDGIVMDVEIPHPSGRNHSRWRGWLATRRSG